MTSSVTASRSASPVPGEYLCGEVPQALAKACASLSGVGAVPSIAEHPLRLYFNLGARITINTDNRGREQLPD